MTRKAAIAITVAPALTTNSAELPVTLNDVSHLKDRVFLNKSSQNYTGHHLSYGITASHLTQPDTQVLHLPITEG